MGDGSSADGGRTTGEPGDGPDGSDRTDRCPHLDYRTEGNGHAFETARAYCTRAGRFVQPMRADICNARYGLDHATDCEIFRGDGDP